MYEADTTHATLSFSANALVTSGRAAIAEARWARATMVMLSAAIDHGPAAVEAVLSLVTADKARIAGMDAILAGGDTAITQAFTALVMAGEKIPNTTPPRADGLESL